VDLTSGFHGKRNIEGRDDGAFRSHWNLGKNANEKNGGSRQAWCLTGEGE
jgi:hypothetical protein